MMSSPAARRVIVGAGLAVAFGIGISIIMAPAMQGAKNQAALDAPSAAASSGQTVVNSPAADSADSANSAASAREAATAPVAPPAVATPGPETSNPLLAANMDGRITAQVRSSIASLAPGSNIDVKAVSGIVALAGTVPSPDVVEQARQAAQQVPGVRQVDTSALLVANR